MAQSWKDNHAVFLVIVGLLAWLVPGGGHFAGWCREGDTSR